MKREQYERALHYRIRKLTPRECGRLMGVDDEDIDKMINAKVILRPTKGKAVERPMPKTQLYKMFGNSIVVDCLYYVFRNMFIPEYQTPKASSGEGMQLKLFD